MGPETRDYLVEKHDVWAAELGAMTVETSPVRLCCIRNQKSNVMISDGTNFPIQQTVFHANNFNSGQILCK
jgi:hypothetical protein